MRFFSRSKDQARAKGSDDGSRPYSVKLSDRDYDQLRNCDTPLKFWLPEPVEKMIDEMCAFQDTSASDLIRQILFIHLYGRYDLFGLIERQDNTFKLNGRIRFSESINEVKGSVPPVAKSIADVKLWIPKQMKADLQGLADGSEKKLSAYVREVLQVHLFGIIPPHGMTLDKSPPVYYIED